VSAAGAGLTGVEPRAGSAPVLRTRLLAAAAWPLLPLLLLQGAWLRRRVPRLPEASEPTGSTPGNGAPLRLLLLGESTAAGVGVERHAQGIGGQLARELTRRTGRPVAWCAVGRNGATARITRDALLPRVPAGPWDAVVIALGVNDVLRMHRPARWAADLASLVDALRSRPGIGRVVLAPVPPMGCFPAIPQPLRAVLGARAACLDAAAHRVATRLGAPRAALDHEVPDPALFCRDGVHPSEAGYAAWARLLPDVLVP
jgi:lysophospholipase L1-like esterase